VTFGQQKIKKMDTTEVPEGWTAKKEKLKQKFAMLTDNDLKFTVGKKDEMIERLQTKLGKTKEEIQKIIEAL